MVEIRQKPDHDLERVLDFPQTSGTLSRRFPIEEMSKIYQEMEEI
jgi:hypothetical protein